FPEELTKAAGVQLPGDLSPMTTNSFSPITDAIHYFKSDSYTLWRYFGGADGQLKPLPNDFRQGLVIVLSSFASARNLDQAELPAYMRSFIEANGELLKTPFIKYDCSTGQKSADISGLFSPNSTSSGTVRF
ncbi:MAG TPA: hypothetical protein VKV02_02555, partial [Acidobacteriaceae bacterium]|nr:hypothetical protein [Acidobacteriaceae bacterium]